MFVEFFDDIEFIDEIFGNLKRVHVMRNGKAMTLAIKLGDMEKYDTEKISAELQGEYLVLRIPFKQIEKKLIPLKVVKDEKENEK
jgi:hypothetical protein